MNCPRCEELVDEGAAFCGNCGLDVRELNRPVHDDAGDEAAEVAARQAGLPRYAVDNPLQAKFEGKAMVALVIGVLAVPAALVPFAGGLLALIGLVLATTSRALLPHKAISNLAVGFSCFGLVLSLAAFAYNADQLNRRQPAINKVAAEEPVLVGGGHAETQCYSLDVPELEHVEAGASGCALRAYNAATMSASSRALTVDAARQADLTADNFPAAAKNLADGYVRQILPGFVLSAQQLSQFAGSPSYNIDAKKDAVNIQLAIVYHPAPSGDNLFVVIHGSDLATENLKSYETAWIWK